MAADASPLAIRDGSGVAQTIPTYADASGNLIPIHSTDSSVAHYRAASLIAVANISASCTDLAVLTGSATKTVRVKSIRVRGGATTGLVGDMRLMKHTVADTAGTKATAPDIVPLDSGNAAASATFNIYTSNPTIDASAKQLAAVKFACTAVTTAPGEVLWTFGQGDQSAVLRGIAQEIAINLNGTTPGANAVLSIEVEWAEDGS